MTFPHAFIVIDQNQLRNQIAVAAALDRCCRERLSLLLPDGAFFEFSKGTVPFDTWKASLRTLARKWEL